MVTELVGSSPRYHRGEVGWWGPGLGGRAGWASPSCLASPRRRCCAPGREAPPLSSRSLQWKGLRPSPLGGQSLCINLLSSLSWPGLGSPCLGGVGESQTLAARVGPVTPLSASTEPGVLHHGHRGPQRGQVLPDQLPPEAAPQERYWRVRLVC